MCQKDRHMLSSESQRMKRQEVMRKNLNFGKIRQENDLKNNFRVNMQNLLEHYILPLTTN
jgi:hypothetical protein